MTKEQSVDPTSLPPTTVPFSSSSFLSTPPSSEDECIELKKRVLSQLQTFLDQISPQIETNPVLAHYWGLDAELKLTEYEISQTTFADPKDKTSFNCISQQIEEIVTRSAALLDQQNQQQIKQQLIDGRILLLLNKLNAWYQVHSFLPSTPWKLGIAWLACSVLLVAITPLIPHLAPWFGVSIFYFSAFLFSLIFILPPLSLAWHFKFFLHRKIIQKRIQPILHAADDCLIQNPSREMVESIILRYRHFFKFYGRKAPFKNEINAATRIIQDRLDQGKSRLNFSGPPPNFS